jgi:hypothetical protein
MKRSRCFLLLLLFALAPTRAGAVQFSRQLNDGVLLIKAPASYDSDGQKIFSDETNRYGVTLTYAGLTIETNRASLDRQQNTIEISFGFQGSFEGYTLSGDYFRINPATRNFSGQGMKFGYLSAYLRAGRLQYNGEEIVAEDVSAAPFDFPAFGLTAGRLEISPGYLLSRSNVLRFFFIPCYYIPLYFNDQRRSYFPLPFPAFEAAQDIYHGNSAAVHSNYFFTPNLYGDIALRLSQNDGYGAGFQQDVRLSDNHQLALNYVGWQKSPAQFKLSYVFNYFRTPPLPSRELSFQEQSERVRKIAGLESLLTLNADYSQNEDYSRGRIDRYPQLTLSSRLKGNLADHVYTLIPSVSYGRIREKRIFPENAAPQNVNNDYQRRAFGLNWTYFLETPYIKPYVNRALVVLDYQHANYDPGTAYRDRLASSLTIRRPLLNINGLNYEFVLTKVLVNYGQSPFFFEEYGYLLQDNVALDIYRQTNHLIGGGQFVYDLTNGAPYNEVYYFGVKALGDSFAVIRHDRRMQLWEFAIMKKDLAF